MNLNQISIMVRFGIISALRGDPVVFENKLKEEFVTRGYVDNIDQVNVSNDISSCSDLQIHKTNILHSAAYGESIKNKLDGVDLQEIIETVFAKSTVDSPESKARFK